ncbi:NAD(P)H-hydrate dehydratase [Flavobacteriaceae bacterium 14752]|uniref:NAD(P)H-hydrate dehydratase n=1 Tax=Mesohalobacter salilacus TaxID=2491711 RepID=UPI000F63C1BE|nr:NAD(P)H-hydrate dehydratase [Flavobacteriaceae bacterium 14752]
MKILTPSQLQKTDAYTIEHQQISSWELMERASLAALKEIKNITLNPQPVTVLAGSGNNGGDGLAIAYHLDQLGYKVNVLLLKYTPKLSKDCKINLDRLKANTSINIQEYIDTSSIEDLKIESIIIDAVFGIGLNRTLPNFVEKIISSANKRTALRIAVDLPSGLFLSKLTPENAKVFKAEYTLTFQCPKLNFFLPAYGNDLGEIKIIDIGLDQDFIDHLETEYEYVDEKFITKFYKTRQRFSHKGNYGHLLIVGGQYGMMGSVSLAAKSALKSGVGKVTVLSPKCGVEVLQQSVPEAMVIAADQNESVSPKELKFEPSNICIGMGLGQSEQALGTLKYFITEAKTPMLIDADGINLLAQNKDFLKALPAQSILTPHQGELKRLIGEWQDDYDKLEKVKSFVKTYNVILVAKDAYTFIASQDKIYINSTGNAGLATAGSGDTLSGIISSFLCQKYLPIEASILGVYAHGKAADIYANKYDENSLIASDIIKYLKNVFLQLKSHKH